MKYIHYLLVMLFTVIRKVIGLPMFWVAAPFRGYARNVVYNYKLKNGKWLKRLYERNPTKPTELYYHLNGDRTIVGCVKIRNITTIEYLLVYWLIWGWLDDDSNYDCNSLGYLETLINGERENWFTKLFKGRLKKEYDYLNTCKFGSTFELGDVRTHFKVSLSKTWLSTSLWVWRNTAYNFKYDQYETVDTKRVFRFDIKGKVFGWVPEGVVDGKQNYSLRFWEGPE